MADTAHRLTDEKLEEMENRLSAIYSRAQKDVQKKADEYFETFYKEDEVQRRLLEKGEISKEEYKSWQQSKIMRGRRYTEMKEQIAAELLNINKTAVAYVNGKLPEIYTLNYNSVAEVAESTVKGYSFTLCDQSTVKYLSTSNKTLLPYKRVDGKKDIRWNTKNINYQILQGVLQGESIPKIAKRLENVTEMNKKAAIRNARTAVTSAQNKGRIDSYRRLQDDGLKVKKRWDATLDGRTRHEHGMLDGVTIDIDKPFINGIGKIMFPGSPDAHPANVYNCRCRMSADVGQARGEYRIARDENGKSVPVPNMTYKEWIEWREKGER